MEFWIFVIFIETFLEQSIWICKWVSWWCHRLTIFHVFCSEKCENPIFQLWESKTCLISTLNKYRISLLSYFDVGERLLHVWAFFFIIIFKIVYTKYGNLWGDEIINSLICIFMSTVQEMLRWKLQKFKISYLPYSLSDLHQIFTVPFEM